MTCLFCEIAAHQKPAHRVFEDDVCMVFLDQFPVFWGHCLVIPKAHYETLADVSNSDLPVLFQRVQQVSQAIPIALEAQGTLVAINNKVSQSVPHLHIHVIPRRKKDGLKGFFWPRHRYTDETQKQAIAIAIQNAMANA